MQEIKNNNINLIPVDSEHSAIFQCLRVEKDNLKNLAYCFGGPFRDFTLQELELVNVEMALVILTGQWGPRLPLIQLP